MSKFLFVVVVAAVVVAVAGLVASGQNNLYVRCKAALIFPLVFFPVAFFFYFGEA